MAIDWFQQNAPPAWPNGGGGTGLSVTGKPFSDPGRPGNGLIDPNVVNRAAAEAGYGNDGRMPWDEQNPYQPKGPWTPQPGGIIDPNVVNRAAQQATGGGGQNGTIDWGNLQSRLNPNMSEAELDAWVNDAFAAQGKQATDKDRAAWRDYWNQWGKNDPGYFFKRFSTPDGGGQQGGQGGGPGGFGSGWNTLPTADELKANPGFQYALDEAQRGMQNSAAAKGTLLNGRTNQAMSQNLANYALGNFYLPLANLGLNYNQANQDNLLRWGQLGLNGSSVGATGRPA